MSSSNLSVTQVLEREKYLNDKVDNVNVNFEMIFLHLASVLRNIKRLQIKEDRLSETFRFYADQETPGIQKSFTELSAAVLKSTTYSQAKFDQIHAFVLDVIRKYEEIASRTKMVLKDREKAVTKLSKKQAAFKKYSQKGGTDAGKLNQLQSEVNYATTELNNLNKTLQTSLEDFEINKIKDCKAVTKAYIHAEVAYHARCLSEFSRIAPIPDEIDVDEEAEHLIDMVTLESRNKAARERRAEMKDENSDDDSDFSEEEEPKKKSRASSSKR
eukprot:TRINITY_DN5375_c0_g1_i1.p1 TRINITY_DN5375_c0_g1~~TRINITY_DN5375_c0_g1_i1.p1  ORF type:complete len:272 (+),score=54.52 TRINITY_DN5375_c0_g1_i1:76-891(+)